MSRPLAAFGFLLFAYFAAIGLFNPYAPLWFKELGFSTVVIGGISALQSWSRVVAPYAWSWLGDHSGRRVELIRLSAAGALAAALALLGVQAALPVAVVTTLLFVANSGMMPLQEATVSRLLSTGQGMDTGRYGRVRVWGSVGFMVSVTGFGALLQGVGIGVFPYLVASMNGLMLLAALRLPSTPQAAAHAEPAPRVWPTLKRPAVAWFFASVAFTVLAHTALYAFFSLYLVSLGYGKAAVGALWAVSVFVEILFFWFQGRWFSRFTLHGWLSIAAWVTAARFLATGFGGASLALLVVAQASHVVTFAAHHAACIAMVHRHFPERLRGRGQALYTTLGYGLPGVIGGFGGGWLVDRAGFTALFTAAATSAAVSGLCVWRAALCERRSRQVGQAAHG